MNPHLITLGLLAVLAAQPARADIPVIDNTNLNQHSHTHDHTNATVKLQTNTKNNTTGINCSVHTGGKNADATDPQSKPNAQTGANEVTQYGGPSVTSNGPSQDGIDGAGRQQTGNIGAQQQATADDVKTLEQTYTKLSKAIGETTTVKGAWDQNSVIAVQNGLALNDAIKITNIWVEAANLVNLFRVSETSAGAAVSSPPETASCVGGTIGDGTRARPCTSKTCETVELSQIPSPACVTVIYHDSYNHVAAYLLTIEDVVNLKTQGVVFN